jgi:catecholate siderophore receptor
MEVLLGTVSHALKFKQPFTLLPIAAAVIAVSTSSWAQTTATAEKTLKPVVVVEKAEAIGKNSLQVTDTSIGKGKQALRDIPQSITVVTEKLTIAIGYLERSFALVTFLAAEGGERRHSFAWFFVYHGRYCLRRHVRL